SGQVDFVLDPPFQDLNRIGRSAKLKVVQTPQIRTIFLGLDTGVKELRTSDVKGKNPFADAKVREAMYRAIDIAAIRKVVMRGLAVPAGIITSPGVHGYTQALNGRLSYDPAKAKALLAEAGYPNGFTVRLDCPNNRYNNDEKICIAVVGMLGKVGIKVNLDAIPKSKHFPKIQKRVTDFYMLGWGVPTLDSHYVFTYLYHSKGPWNATGYANPRVDELTDAMPVTVDLKKRDAMIAEAWKHVKGANAYLPLHHQVIVWGMSKKLDLPIRADDSPHFRWAKMSK
ncbi:MAG: ABC transporter substrate-binding protein, partial [Rhodospirillaceae bacterium]|nr:ABC transporter substrate-binding protein [Rhodospirillaceae bacterium]